jgi:hypothetical protein
VNIEPDDAIMLAVLLSESIEAIRFPQVTATINGKETAVWCRVRVSAFVQL